jgi:Tfp pilus assembly protein PilF
MATAEKLFVVVIFAFIASSSPAFAQTAEQNAYARFLKEGSAQMKSGDYEAARESFEHALEYNDAAPEGHLGLGIAYFHLRDDKHAEWELNRALEIDPKEAMADEFLGELYYRKDDLETAASYWEKAVALKPSNAALRARLDRIRKEHKAEKDFNRDTTGHFLVKYEGREKVETGRIVLRVLEDAYEEVGRALIYYPNREI